MTAGNWLVTVDRETGAATTELVASSDDAWQRSIDIERANPRMFATVVRRIAREG